MVTDPEVQATDTVLMVQPHAFTSNVETIDSNSFQSAGSGTAPDVTHTARKEFDAAAATLDSNGIRVYVVEGRSQGDAPDEVFPNNWVSFHSDGTVVLYPMMAGNRRLERRLAVLEALDRDLGYRVTRIIDLSHHEEQGRFLEGTGSLVLDLDVLGDFAQQLDYEVVAFQATDDNGAPIYHTNVLMSVGARFAVLCSAAISDPDKRAAMLGRLESSGRKVIELDLGQLRYFCGNLLELTTPSGPVIALSSQALDALEPHQQAALQAFGRLVTADIPTIETYGGGSLRCMLAEIHLPA